MHIEAYECPEQPGMWRVLLYADWGDENPMLTIFEGPHSRMRAMDYAKLLEQRAGEFLECKGK